MTKSIYKISDYRYWLYESRDYKDKFSASTKYHLACIMLYLELEGLKFCVDFGIENAIAQARKLGIDGRRIDAIAERYALGDSIELLAEDYELSTGAIELVIESMKIADINANLRQLFQR